MNKLVSPSNAAVIIFLVFSAVLTVVTYFLVRKP